MLVRVRRTIKPKDFVFFTFLMESPEILGKQHILANRRLGGALALWAHRAL